MKIYSIFDKKSNNYGPVMCFPNDVMAIRAVEMDLMNGQSVMASYPHDFALMLVGTFDESVGCITADNMPTNVYECANYLAKAEK